MSDNEAEANHRIVPLINTAVMRRIAAIPVTTSSQVVDLSALLTKIDDGHYYSFRSHGGICFLAFNNVSSGTVLETSTSTTTPANDMCYDIPDGGEEEWQIPEGFHFLVVKGSAALTLRIALSSKNPNQMVLKNEV